MATIHSISSDLSSLVAQLRQALGSIKDSTNTSGLSAVMGRSCRESARMTSTEHQRVIQDDHRYQQTAGPWTEEAKKEVDAHIRRLLDNYGEKVADGTYATTYTEFEARVATPATVKAKAAEALLVTMIESSDVGSPLIWGLRMHPCMQISTGTKISRGSLLWCRHQSSNPDFLNARACTA